MAKQEGKQVSNVFVFTNTSNQNPIDTRVEIYRDSSTGNFVVEKFFCLYTNYELIKEGALPGIQVGDGYPYLQNYNGAYFENVQVSGNGKLDFDGMSGDGGLAGSNQLDITFDGIKLNGTLQPLVIIQIQSKTKTNYTYSTYKDNPVECYRYQLRLVFSIDKNAFQPGYGTWDEFTLWVRFVRDVDAANSDPSNANNVVGEVWTFEYK